MRADEKNEARHRNATDELGKIGTNAVPYLLSEAFNFQRDTASRSNFYAILDKFPHSWNLPILISRDLVRAEAVEVLGKIQPPAGAVLPFLESALNETNTSRHNQAIHILGLVGEGMDTLVPYFRRALGDSDRNSRWIAVSCIIGIGPKAQAAMPDLLEFAQKPENAHKAEQTLAVMALGRIGSNAAPAVPFLRETFENETNANERCIRAIALCEIDPSETKSREFLKQTLRSGDAEVTGRLLETLGYNRQDAGFAIPMILDALGRTNWWFLKRAIESLEELGAPAELYLPKVREKLKAEDELTQVYAASYILMIDRADQESRSALIELIKKRSSREEWAIRALGFARSNAVEAIPLLLDALDETNRENQELWQSAALTLKKIGVAPSAFIPKIKAKLKSQDDMERVDAAQIILENDPADQDAQQTLIELIVKQSTRQANAIYVLGQAGPAAKGAIPCLRKSLKSEDDEVSKQAAGALKKIQTMGSKQ